ncbi:hypothetical protein A2U01_0034308, partial [Trifolium medium]|nr:hypothetical protein [Trifolium medium]
ISILSNQPNNRRDDNIEISMKNDYLVYISWKWGETGLTVDITIGVSTCSQKWI